MLPLKHFLIEVKRRVARKKQHLLELSNKVVDNDAIMEAESRNVLEIHAELEKKEHNFTDVHDSISEYNARIEALGEKVNCARADCQVQSAAIERMDLAVKVQQQNLEACENEAAVAQQTCAQHQTELNKLLAELQQQLKEKRSQNASSEAKLGEIERRLESYVGAEAQECAEIGIKLRQLKSEMEVLEDQLQCLETSKQQKADNLLKKKSTLEEKRAAFSEDIVKYRSTIREQADEIASKERDNAAQRDALSEQEVRARQESGRHSQLFEHLDDLQGELDLLQFLMEEDKIRLEEVKLTSATTKEKMQAGVEKNKMLIEVSEQLETQEECDLENLKLLDGKRIAYCMDREERIKSWAKEKQTLRAGIESANKSSELLGLEKAIQDEKGMRADMEDKDAENDKIRKNLMYAVKHNIRAQQLLSESSKAKHAQELAALKWEKDIQVKRRTARDDVIAATQNMGDEKKTLIEDKARIEEELAALETTHMTEEIEYKARLAALQVQMVHNIKDINTSTNKRRLHEEERIKLQAEVLALKQDDGIHKPPQPAPASVMMKKPKPRVRKMPKQAR